MDVRKEEEMRALLIEQDKERCNTKTKNMVKSSFFLPILRLLAHVGFVDPIPGDERTIQVTPDWAAPAARHFAANIVKTQKYNFVTFLPKNLFGQFRYFFNMYFLVVALTQIIPALMVGFTFTYVAPLVFVCSISMIKEIYDDVQRWKQDKAANSTIYARLLANGDTEDVPSNMLRVGDVIIIHTNQRVPADCVLLRTADKTGACFIRTDQLDGETDWKLRHAVSSSQTLPAATGIWELQSNVYVEQPRKDIYEFIGNFYNSNGTVEPLNLENTLWCNTVVASSICTALVVYTGHDTRSAMNASRPPSKTGLLDLELNFMSKLLCAFMILLGLAMVAMQKFQGLWLVSWFRFILLFSSIIPISLRVNLDMGKTVYSIFIMRDKKIPGTIVRNSNLPEELGRISFLLSDKTGTLTCNEMYFRKLLLSSTVKFMQDNLFEIQTTLANYNPEHNKTGQVGTATLKKDRKRKERKGDGAMDVPEAESSEVQATGPVVYFREPQSTEARLCECMFCISLCHNVTPVEGENGGTEYQASSPDEVALVKFAESVGIKLLKRDAQSMTIVTPNGEERVFQILVNFPFTSETKRMGIVVKCQNTGLITFYSKGADVIMQKIVKKTNWLEEECTELAREGLRTLVFGYKHISEEEFNSFNEKYNRARASLENRADMVLNTRKELESNLELIGVTGVEDKLQQDVQNSLEELRNAGIKVWMLTGDKIETATCIARSTRLVGRNQIIYTIIASNLPDLIQKYDEFSEIAASNSVAIVMDGGTLQLALEETEERFVKETSKCGSVVICRCSPTQKATVVTTVQKYNTGKRVAAIGDGGNDVSMIQAAHVGLGIVGKEGKHASMAADFSISQFSHCKSLILWHGRNSYLRSAKLSQFIFHRGIIISIIQAVFSAIFYFASLPVFTGWLMVGYTSWYTMCPVFSLVLDEDVSEETVLKFPELYSELQKGRALNSRTFLTWSWMAIYQGGVIMVLSIVLFESSMLQIVSISFTALLLTELSMVFMEMHRRRRLVFLLGLLGSFGTFLISVFALPAYFDRRFMGSGQFVWKVTVIVLCSLVPVYFPAVILRYINPPAHLKLAHS